MVSFPQVSPPKPCMHLSAIRATCPANIIGVVLITQIIFCEIKDFKALCYVVFLLPCYLVPLKPKYPPKPPVLKHPTPMFLSQCGRISSTTGKVLHTLIFIYFYSKLDNLRFCTKC